MFKLVSKFEPTGDQPQAIEQLVQSIENEGAEHVTLLGVTGSGKTFTMANVIQKLDRPTIILSHNKTLAGQLYNEFKSFFPENAVEYFVSYYDYYQPEAYIPQSDTYIEKDLAINEEIEKMRISTASALLSGRRDIIVVSSVSCLYGIGNPEDFHANTIHLKVGEKFDRQRFLHKLTDALYSRSDMDFKGGTFRVKGDSIDVYLAYSNIIYRIIFFDNTIEDIYVINHVTGARMEILDEVKIYPAGNFVTTRDRIKNAINHIQDDLVERMHHFEELGQNVEAKRLKSRVEYDMEMIKEVGYCSGIENYSRYFDGRAPGTRPFCLLDYFPNDFLTIIDESHVTIPQINGMFGGDFSRKTNLVNYGFRLPSAMDNRPLKFDEFDKLTGQTVYVSATPANYELSKCEGVVVEQVIRPTGLLDPPIEVRKTDNQIDDILNEINETIKYQDRVIITTLTKRMAEELTKYIERAGVRCRYIHSEVDTLDRIQIIDEFREGIFDVLIGVNLLREGIDIPQVALVIIMDADKEGFLRSARSLTQTAGRAARNVNGRVIMYADVITNSMQQTITDTQNRRNKQIEYNKTHGVKPRQIDRTFNKSTLTSSTPSDSGNSGKFKSRGRGVEYDISYKIPEKMVAEKEVEYNPISGADIDEMIAAQKKLMEEAAKKLDFGQAAIHRDAMYNLMKKK